MINNEINKLWIHDHQSKPFKGMKCCKFEDTFEEIHERQLEKAKELIDHETHPNDDLIESLAYL